MKCLFSSKKASSHSHRRRERKVRERERERRRKKQEIVSALSANDVGKKEDGKERMDGNVGGGKRVIRKNRFNTKLLSSSLAGARTSRMRLSFLFCSSLVLKPKTVPMRHDIIAF